MTSDITITSITGNVTAMHPNVSSLKIANYTIISSDYIVGIGSLTSHIAVALPASPIIGDEYIIKDVNGTVGVYGITIDGNGSNIDGLSVFLMAQNYASYTFVYTGTQWSVIVAYAGQQNGNGFGLYAMRPVQGQSGRTYYATDQAVFYYDDGYVWNAIGPQIRPVKFPILSDFTWINQNGAIASDTGSGFHLESIGINSGARSARMLVKPAPSTPYKIDVCFEYAGVTTVSTYNGLVGLCFRESSSGKIQTHTVDFNSSGDCQMISAKYDNATSFNSNYRVDVNDFVAGILWLRIQDDGANRYCWYSRDGINFTNFHFIGRTDYIIADQVGIFIDPIYQDIKVTYVSWIQG